MQFQTDIQNSLRVVLTNKQLSQTVNQLHQLFLIAKVNIHEAGHHRCCVLLRPYILLGLGQDLVRFMDNLQRRPMVKQTLTFVHQVLCYGTDLG